LADASITHIVVEHKDRASRFGIEPIRTLLQVGGRELVVVNEVAGGEEDLMEDFAAIITSFVARLYGRRRARRKTAEVLAALEQGEE
jgi:predicted site-specific integrase-resolvase